MSDENTQSENEVSKDTPTETTSEAGKVGLYHRDDEDRISFDHLFTEEEDKIKSIFRGSVFVKSIKKTPISSDIIDFIFETYTTNPSVIALQLNYNIPGVMDIISNINNKNIHWEVCSVPGKDGEPGKIDISLRFQLTQDELDARLDELRTAGIKDNFIKISETEFIDYGEIEKVCRIHYFVDENAEWIVREEPVQMNLGEESEDPDNSTNGADLVSGYISGISIMKKSQDKAMYGDTTGAIFIGFASPNPIFSNEQVSDVEEVSPDENKSKIEIRIDPDTECTPIARQREEFESDEAYDDFIKSELHRTDVMKAYWKSVFGSSSNFVQEMIRIYASDYAVAHEVDGKPFTGTISITKAEFESYISEKGLLENFKKELESSCGASLFDDPELMDGGRKAINDEIRTSAAATEIIKEYESILPEFNQVLLDTAREFGCLIDSENGQTIDPLNEKYKEFVDVFMKKDICVRSAKVLHTYIVQVMRDTGEFDEEFLANDTPILRSHKMYQEIARQIGSYAKNQ